MVASGTWPSTWSPSMACCPRSASLRLSPANQGTTEQLDKTSRIWYLFHYSSRLNNILKSKLREYARSLRLAIDKGNTDNELRVQIAGMMAEVYRWVSLNFKPLFNCFFRIVGICLGVPPMHFTWEYTDKAKQVKFLSFNIIHTRNQTQTQIFNRMCFNIYRMCFNLLQNISQNISIIFDFNILQVQTVGPISPLEFYNQWVKPVWNIEDKICLVNLSPHELSLALLSDTHIQIVPFSVSYI